MAGTGSVVVAVNEVGQQVRTGGWGYLFGDAGGGWHIGFLAARLTLQNLDAGKSISPLGRMLMAELGVATPPEIVYGVYSGRINRLQIARLAEVVAHVAQQGDNEGCHILAEAASNFAIDVATAINRLIWSNPPVKVATLGRIFKSGDL
ncbi:MAG: hypothetical protein M1609_03390, partial [Firmicutes bacterium]|nr:hypothetical protein [Bacillota bacterium]